MLTSQATVADCRSCKGSGTAGPAHGLPAHCFLYADSNLGEKTCLTLLYSKNMSRELHDSLTVSGGAWCSCVLQLQQDNGLGDARLQHGMVLVRGNRLCALLWCGNA
jgi:hypothetical protein